MCPKQRADNDICYTTCTLLCSLSLSPRDLSRRLGREGRRVTARRLQLDLLHSLRRLHARGGGHRHRCRDGHLGQGGYLRHRGNRRVGHQRARTLLGGPSWGLVAGASHVELRGSNVSPAPAPSCACGEKHSPGRFPQTRPASDPLCDPDCISTFPLGIPQQWATYRSHSSGQKTSSRPSGNGCRASPEVSHAPSPPPLSGGPPRTGRGCT